MSNHISIFRKKVKNNIPGFSDPQASTQNEWFKLADFQCVEYYPGQTARTYDLEHAEGYSNQDDMSYYEFSFENVRQALQPPYDINTGDYIGFKQGESVFFYRIVRSTITGLFAGCCVVQIMVNITQPREAQYLMECGETQALSEDDLMGGTITDTTNGIIVGRS